MGYKDDYDSDALVSWYISEGLHIIIGKYHSEPNLYVYLIKKPS